jgi:hypothetical protein
MTQAFEAVATRMGLDWAYLLCGENPARVVRGEKLAVVPAQSQPEVA